MREILATNLASGEDLGASVAVIVNGEMVVDLWGGWADSDRTRAWGEHTITNVWSTTKTMTNLTALVLADRGLLDLDAPVARYWPEFAANGKQGVLVRDLLAHTSGVSAWAQPVTLEDVYDLPKSTAMLAAQPLWWERGTASGYHAFNQGHLVGEVVRRVTGKTLGRYFADEVAGPLGADFHIGLAAEHDHRVSNIVPPPPLPFDLDSLDRNSVMYKTFTGPAPDPTAAWTTAWRRAEIGAANGHGNARSVARIQAVVSNGGVIDGVKLLSPATIARIFEEQSNGVDLAIGIPLRFGIGYALPESQTMPDLPQGRVCYWGGWGGSLVVNDLDQNMTVAYMMNKMAPGIIGGPRSAALLGAAYAALG
jgi:CubicO group peptidase (beta-lactamase class C family)